MKFRTFSLCCLETLLALNVIGCQVNSASLVSESQQAGQTVLPSGNATTPVVSLSPTSMTFASTPVNTMAGTQAITFTNTGSETLSMSGTGLGISITGTDASSYSQTNTCGTSVTPGASCVITVTFNPDSSGTLNATVSIPIDVAEASQSVPLSGTGVAVAASSSSEIGNVYYVDNSIPDINVNSAVPDCTTYNPTTFVCGTGSASAFATIADINKYKKFKPGDQVLFRRGEIWRDELTTSGMTPGSAGKPITFSAYGDSYSPLPIISGANLFTEWTPLQVMNGEYPTTIYSTPYIIIPGDGHDFNGVPYAYTPSQVFEDGGRLLQNTTSNNSLTAGQWYLDTENSLIWVRLTGDDNPSGHTIEATQRDYGIIVYGTSYINILYLQTEAASIGINMSAGNDNNVVITGVISRNNYVQGIAICSSVNFILSSSMVANNGGLGITVFQTSNALIDGNSVHDNGQLSTIGWAAGIKGGGPNVTNIMVQNNLIYSNGIVGGAEVLRGIDFDTVGPGAIIRYNKIYSNTYDGIELDATNDATVYGNVVYGNGHYGIRAFADAQPTPMTGILIYNNTVYGNSGGGIMLLGPTMSTLVPHGCMNNTVTNNIVMNSINGPNLMAADGCENSGVYGSGNIYAFNDFGPESSHFIEWGDNPKIVYESTYAAWESAAGNCGESGCSHSVESDPLFTDPSANYFTLSRYSPAIGAGLNLGNEYQNDLNPASVWPQNVILTSQNSPGGGWTIGAYTYTELSDVFSIQYTEVPVVGTVYNFH